MAHATITVEVIHTLDDKAEHILRHIVRAFTKAIEENIMTTKDEILAGLAELKKDLQRVVTKLNEALENQNLDEVKAAVDELDAIAEAASPEPVEEPTPEG